MGAGAKEASVKERVQELMEEGKQATKSLMDLKKRYEKYKALYERGKKLIDKDTRDAAIFKEALSLALKEAGALIGEDLTKSPYFVLNKPGIDALIDAITASDTINNARKLLSDAEKELDKLQKGADKYVSQAGKSYWLRRDAFVNILRRSNPTQIDWVRYVDDLNYGGFAGMTRDQAMDEVANALDMAGLILEDIRDDVDLTLLVAFKVLPEYAALAAAGANIVLAEKTYTQKIQELAGSKSTIKSGFGKLEQERQQNERGYDDVQNTNGGGKSLAERVAAVMDKASQVADDWRYMIYVCTHADKLLDLDVQGRYLPWEMPLP